MAISLIVFDCDGVILESVNVKTSAFEKIVEKYGPDAVKRMTEYHIAHGGVSRFRKFEWFYLEVLGRRITEDELQTLSLEFSQLVFDGVICAPLVTGIMETLLFFHGRLPMYVASGTPHEELRQVLDARNLTRFFKAAYGAPPGKTELLRHIINQEGVSPKNTLMVGDSSTDLDATEACGAHFFGVGSAFSGTSWPYASDCTAIVKWVDEQRMD